MLAAEITPTASRSLSDVFSSLGVEVTHHFGGGVYAKDTAIPAGVTLTQHKHKFDHLSILAEGSVNVCVDGERVAYAAPACIVIAAGKAHSVEAITDARWYCIHAIDDAFHDDVDLIA